MRLADVQREFAGGVLRPDGAVPAQVRRKSGGSPARRFDVYRNNVFASLIDVLAGRFPAVQRLVGDEFFRVMARLYVEGEPPCSAVLIRYGATFPDFVARFPPASTVPYLGDVAALEWAWHAAYHAADAEPLALTALAAAAEHAEDATLRLHPSLGVVRSAFPIVSIFELNRQSGEVPPTQLEGAEDALVLRPCLEVQVRRLPEGGAAFILALNEGNTIGEAAAAALEQASGFDLEAGLAGLIASGAVIGIAASIS